MPNNNLGDEFSNPLGEWVDYSVLPEGHAEQIPKQKHTDLRSVLPKSKEVKITMVHITAMMNIGTLNERTMNQLNGTFRSSTGEEWSKGYIAKDPARNNWPVLIIDCKSGHTTVSQSVLRR